MSLTNNKWKKVVMPIALSTLVLSGCGETKVEEQTTEVTTEATTEATTQVTTEAVTEEVTEALEQEEVKTDYYALAAETYNKYTNFYSNTGFAYEDENAPQGINIERIENMIKVIDGEVADLTGSDVSTAKETMNYILLSQELVDNLSDAYSEELGYVTIEGQFNMCDAPSIYEYATDEETREFVKKYEELRNKVQEDLNNTNRVSEETKQELKDAVVEMEKEYIPEDTTMNNDVNAEGNKLLENLAKEKLVELTALSINQSRIETDEFPGGLVIAPETRQERDVNSKVIIHGIEILTDSEKLVYSEMLMKKVGTKYEDGACAHEENLARYANEDDNSHSKIDTYQVKFDLLEQKKFLLKQKQLIEEAKMQDVEVKSFC